MRAALNVATQFAVGVFENVYVGCGVSVGKVVTENVGLFVGVPATGEGDTRLSENTGVGEGLSIRGVRVGFLV